jgi:hypothetical protein
MFRNSRDFKLLTKAHTPGGGDQLGKNRGLAASVGPRVRSQTPLYPLRN